MTTDIHEAITELRKNIEIARIQLAGLAMAACPGPHRPTRRLDVMEPPWCSACGCTADGNQIKTVTRETAQ